jgi:hypothetical protein
MVGEQPVALMRGHQLTKQDWKNIGDPILHIEVRLCPATCAAD